MVRLTKIYTRTGDKGTTALGAKIDVPAFGGAARLRVPPGTQSGQRFRLRDRGVVSARTGARGDLIVEVRSATAGAGSFTFKFDHMAELTGRTADQIVAARRAAE